MKKLVLSFVTILVLVFSLCFTTGCQDNSKVINVCASELPHADILENAVAPILKEKGYTLKVTVLDWTIQNDSVANKDYDANYFQHVPYLELFEGDVKLFAAAKVHYEPLGIYQGKSTGALATGKTFAICNDESNALRALELLKAKGVIENLPVDAEGKLTITGSNWTSDNGVTVTLIAEELLVASMADYDFVCLPCNTALTGNVDTTKQVAKEDDPELVAGKANIIAARVDDYKNDETYKAKIDVLTDAVLSKAVADYVNEKWGGAITCDSSSQIDLR
ncbi:MAG: metal ABC transporter substrate-binding protein [Bacilli bacterium]|nr:metal ABC transporter substrate-binding protein [Bacilli bacterium]